MPDRSGQITELQSLRGLAAAVVAIGHALTFYYMGNGSGYGSLVLNGRAAVVVFFVLSGYVLTRSLRHSSFDRQALVYFYGQRFFRIFPAIWCASLLGLWYLADLHWRIPLTDGSFGAAFRLDRFNAIWIVGSFTGMISYILPQLWSIHVEILASILMPAIAYLALRHHRYLWILLLFAVAVSYRFGEVTPYHSALFLMDFVIGAMLASGIVTPWLQRLSHPRLLITLSLIGMAFTRFLPFAYWSPTAHLLETCLAVLAIGLLATTPVKLMNAAPLLFIGEISYSIYLLHFVVLCTVAKGFALIERHAHLALGQVPLSILLALAASICIVPLAWASYFYVEKPGIRFGRMILTRWHTSLPPRTLVVG
jgi:peptidoglycan/LPS O-acetylase OafA/YrhL